MASPRWRWLFLLGITGSAAQDVSIEPSHWQAWLTVPGGPIYFDLAIDRGQQGGWTAVLTSGGERIEIPRVEVAGSELLLDMPHYDSRIRAKLVHRLRLTGSWEKRRNASELARIPFDATLEVPEAEQTSDSGYDPPAVARRWKVSFETDDKPAVAVIDQQGTELRATLLTSTGDYRYLDGHLESQDLHGEMRTYRTWLTLSCFDGAHAFLFKAKLVNDGRVLRGDFWSGNWHHETWTAKRDD